jgi:transposase InsO family protein
VWACRLAALEPKPPTIRYQKEQPGELIHIDIKKLGRIDSVGHRITTDRSRSSRGKGWEYLHVCVDDAFRLAHTELPPVERQESAAAFLVRALAWFVSLGVTSQRVMTENRRAFRSRAFRMDCAEARLKHECTRPCMSRINGKAERFIPE